MFLALILTPLNQSISESYLGLYHVHKPKPGTKLLFVGASNLPFGIKSSSFEKKGIPFASYGFHGGVGPTYHMNQIPKKSDDTIILSPPPQWLSETSHGQELIQVLSCQTPSTAPDVIYNYGLFIWCLSRAYNLDRFWWDFKQSFSDPQPISEQESGFSYRQSIFDSHGVIKDGMRPIHSHAHFSCSTPGDFDINFWRKYNGTVDYILIPPLAPCPPETLTLIQSKYELLAETLDAELLLDVSDCLLNNEDFSNTNLHLTDEGAERYSEIVSNGLSRALQQP